jgi:hypothetical protein
VRRRQKKRRSWLRTQERWNPELANIFGAAARYRLAKFGSRHDDAHPDNSTLQTSKTYSFPLHISRFVHRLLRQRPGAAATGTAACNGLGTPPNYLRGAAGNGRAQRSITFGAQREPPRATASAPR